jgi:hypothetical protein
LPTVDVTSTEALAAATFRGVRSLRLRDLVDGDGEPGDALSIVVDVAGRTDMTAIFLATEEFERAGWVLSSTHYPLDDGWLIEAVDGTGVHQFDSVTDVERADVLRTLVGLATTGDLAGAVGEIEVGDASRLVLMAFRNRTPAGIFSAGLAGLQRLVVDDQSAALRPDLPAALDDAVDEMDLKAAQGGQVLDGS